MQSVSRRELRSAGLFMQSTARRNRQRYEVLQEQPRSLWQWYGQRMREKEGMQVRGSQHVPSFS